MSLNIIDFVFDILDYKNLFVTVKNEKLCPCQYRPIIISLPSIDCWHRKSLERKCIRRWRCVFESYSLSLYVVVQEGTMQGCSVYIVESYHTSRLMLSRILRINRKMERFRSLLTSRDYQQPGVNRVYLDISLPSIDRRRYKGLERETSPSPPPVSASDLINAHRGVVG